MNEGRRKKRQKIELYNDNFQNYKKYGIPKAQLVIADIPYNLGTNFYASNPMWYNGGDNANGESKLAKKAAFNTDFNFNIAEYFHFCHKLLKRLIQIFTDEGDVVIDPCAGSGTTLRAAKELGRSAYGFEIDKRFYQRAVDEMLADTNEGQLSLFEEAV